MSGDHVALATQSQFPVRAALRTFVQAWLPGMISFVMVLPLILQQVLEAMGETLPAGFTAWMTAAVTLTSALAAAVSRIMAIPAVDAWLERVRLSARGPR